MYMFVYMHMYMYIHVHTGSPVICTYTCIYVHMCVNLYTFLQTVTCMTVLLQVKERKLKEIEKEYPIYLEQQAELQDPVRRLEVGKNPC